MKTLNLLIASLLAAPLLSHAGVNPKNGDFYISYLDITLPSAQHELKFHRTYNSLSSHRGWVGFGWGTVYETHLVVMPDGSAVIHENGNGQNHYYRNENPKDIAKGVDQLVAAIRQKDKLDAAASQALRQKLLGDEELRATKVANYQLHYEWPKNTRVASSNCGYGWLKREADSYQRLDCDGSTDTFDLKGNLLKHEALDGYHFSVNYGPEHPTAIEDSEGKRLDLVWGDNGKLSAITSGDKIHLDYVQDAEGNLISSNEPGTGQRYQYQYDREHNLTRIGYIDDSSMVITYVPNVSGRTQSITERSGDKTELEYRSDPNDAGHYWTKITLTTADGISTSRELEFQNQTSATGAQHLQHYSSQEDEQQEKTVLDKKGRIIQREDAAHTITRYRYNRHNGKISQISSNDLVTNYRYDAKGNLTQARNNQGQIIRLRYNASARISQMVDINRLEHTRRELHFKYNQHGKPTEIELMGRGVIFVAYDEQGEITDVKSEQGAGMALEITAAFQNLLSVVKPCGVQL